MNLPSPAMTFKKVYQTISMNYHTTGLNKGINAIGLSIVEKYLAELLKVTDKQIVSVGSGDGFVENHLEKTFGINIICVDPKKYENSETCKTSEYDTVEQLLKAKPSIKSNCVLFLNWPIPNDSTYDFDAIMSLQPEDIILIFESTGSAGGIKLQEWANYCGIVTDNSWTESNEEYFKITKHNVVHRTSSKTIKPIVGFLEYEIVWLSTNQTKKELDIPTIIGEDFQRPSKSSNHLEMAMGSMLMSLGSLFPKQSNDPFSLGAGNEFSRIQNTMEDSANERKNKLVQENEKTKYGGYYKPNEILTNDEINAMKKVVDECKELEDGDTIECHHPYYRKIIKDYARSIGLVAESSIDICNDMKLDSKMLHHYDCGGKSIDSRIHWRPDYNSWGGIHQMQTKCDICDNTILSDYEDDSSSGFGYEYVMGKNCVVIKMP